MLVGLAATRGEADDAFPSYSPEFPIPTSHASAERFQLSQDYPASAPEPGPTAWDRIDFKSPTAAASYLVAVRDRAYADNLSVDWRAHRGSGRKWYHAPWMHAGDGGREFLRGLTRERDSQPGELHPLQTHTYQNWAVSLYNAAGGSVLGQVWRDPAAPNARAAKFPRGTVAIKLLFTAAPTTEVPYLAGSVEWEAHVNETATRTTPLTPRVVKTLRLLQIDVAVRDDRAAETGWVFGTFVYDDRAPGADAWHRMTPVGLMWGNDPDVVDEKTRSEKGLHETWINPEVRNVQHLGWLGRLNGPVDNPVSSCLSCHMTAQTPMSLPLVPSPLPWFQNVSGDGTVFGCATPLDYSLQLAFGIESHARAAPGSKTPSAVGPRGGRAFTVSRDANSSTMAPAQLPRVPVSAGSGIGTAALLYGAAGLAGLTVGLFAGHRIASRRTRRRRSP